MFNRRKNIILFTFALVGLIYIIKLFALQVLDSSYKLESQDIARRKIVEYPFRGLIYDREGKILVENARVFDLMVVPKDVSINDTALFLKRFDITREEFDKKMKAAISWPNSAYVPSPFLKQLSHEEFARIQDYLVDYKGFFPQRRTIRSYPDSVLANALGYIGEISKSMLEHQEGNYYKSGDYIGISGLEATYEKQLRGKRGVKYIMVDAHGTEKGPYKNGMFDTSAVPGKNLTASVDLELQKYGEELMKWKTGSVVAIEPKTGEILSFVSSPTYDPNLLAGRNFGKNYMRLFKDTLLPLYNRPLMAEYPPGSIFKVGQALVAQELGVADTNTTYFCNKYLVGCHSHPEPLDMEGSIQHSCNPYYYNIFKSIIQQGIVPDSRFDDSEAGYIKWRDKMSEFGFGQRLGIDLPNERAGNLPSEGYYDKVYGDDRWAFSTIYSLSIGQGELGVLPVQMANFAAIIANKGYYYTPHLIKGIGEDEEADEKYKKKHKLDIRPEYFDVAVDGMEKVVSAGTARRAQVEGIAVCGKTGTAQNPHGEDHSVFIAFAPKEDPKIAIAVFVENAGFGGTWAAPIASLMIEKYLKGTVSDTRKEKYILDKKFYEPAPEDSVQSQNQELQALNKREEN